MISINYGDFEINENMSEDEKYASFLKLTNELERTAQALKKMAEPHLEEMRDCVKYVEAEDEYNEYLEKIIVLAKRYNKELSDLSNCALPDCQKPATHLFYVDLFGDGLSIFKGKYCDVHYDLVELAFNSLKVEDNDSCRGCW